MASFPTFESNNTVQLTWQSSVAPDSAPIFKAIDASGSVLSSITAIQSDTTNYYALYTMPGSDQPMVGEWFALKTVSGSARNFVKRFEFRVQQTIVG
jgi:hypothetical protein